MTITGIFLAGLVLGLQASAEPTDLLTPEGDTGCTLESHAYCLAPGRISAAVAEDRLSGAGETFWVADGLLHIVARRPGDSARMCCALQTPLDRISDDGLWGMSYALNRLDEAFIDILPRPTIEGGTAWPDRPVYRGPHALAPVPSVAEIAGTVTNTEYDSAALGRPRRVTYYEPADRPARTRFPVIFVADGGNVNTYAPIAEALVALCEARPVVMVGLWTDGVTEPPQSLADDPRSRDYLWGVHETGFFAHQAFLTDELVPFAERELGASGRAEDRMVFGASSGAAWAVSTALLQPNMFATVGAASLGWPTALNAADTIDPGLTVHLSGGLYEPGFHDDSQAVAERLRNAGATATFTEYVSGHSPLAFEQQFAHALSATFPAENGCVPTEGRTE
jgi:enterochelin esterase-like enzyme